MRRWIAATALIVLSACGGERDPASPGEPKADQAAGGPAGWNAMDACATVGSDAVTKATGKAVTGTALDPKSEPDGLKAGFSMCTFTLAGGAKMTVLTREAANGDDFDAAVAAARKLGEELGSPPVDVPGLGKAAMWTAAPPSLQVFIDDRRYATISMFGANFLPDASDQARAASTVIAQKLTQ